MKLADIKKLKVPELRSRLKELGLDTRGLKTELIGRLWSALEARQSGEDGEEELKLRNDSSQTPRETVDVHAPSSPPTPDAGVTARCKIDRTKVFTDSATQTETDAGLPIQQRNPEFIPAGVPVNHVEEGEVEMQQLDAEDPGEEERRAQPSEERGRGRAFYEFKEEIRYKR